MSNSESSPNVKMNVNDKSAESNNDNTQESNNTPNETVSIDPKKTVQIPVVFLDNIKNILTVAGNRGAFKTQEMYAVGSVFNNLTQIIDANK